jgi:hypothetical protein
MITFLLLLSAQVAFPRIGKPESPPIVEVVVTEERRPSEGVLQANYAKSSADVAEIVRMAEEAKAMLDKGDHRTLPAGVVKKLGQIEKRARVSGTRLGR